MIVILAVKAKFSTMASSKEVSLNKRDADVQPEINMAAKTGNTYFNLRKYGTEHRNSNGRSRVFDTASLKKLFARESYSQAIDTTIDTGNGNVAAKREILMKIFIHRER